MGLNDIGFSGSVPHFFAETLETRRFPKTQKWPIMVLEDGSRRMALTSILVCIRMETYIMSTQNNKTLFAIFASFVILQCACTTTSVDRIQDPRFSRLCAIFTSTNDSHEKLRVGREIASLIDYAIHTEGRKISFRMIMDALGPPTFGSELNFPVIQYDIPDVDNSYEYCLRFEGCTLQKIETARVYDYQTDH